MSSTAWLAEFSRQYYVPLEDYERPGDWLLIASGAGIMMAMMDVEPRFRFCVDVDRVTNRSRLARWAGWASNFVGRVAIAGWFSLSDPQPFREIVTALNGDVLAYTPGIELGAQHCQSLAEFVRRLDGEKSQPARDGERGNRQRIVENEDVHAGLVAAAGPTGVLRPHGAAVDKIRETQRLAAGQSQAIDAEPHDRGASVTGQFNGSRGANQ